jgi:ketosteroid isomerase-like protein
MNITEVPFQSSEATPPGVQVLSFDALLDRARGHQINPGAPMRPTFHHLVAVRGGRLDCSVDFTEHQLGRVSLM